VVDHMRVGALVAEVYSAPFVWGSSDCCTCACDVFRRLHGVDPMAPLRGRYATQEQAHAAIRARGGWRRMFAALTARAGLSEGRGEAGELGLVKTDAGFTLAIGLGGDWWAVRGDAGHSAVEGAILCRSR